MDVSRAVASASLQVKEAAGKACKPLAADRPPRSRNKPSLTGPESAEYRYPVQASKPEEEIPKPPPPPPTRRLCPHQHGSPRAAPPSGKSRRYPGGGGGAGAVGMGAGRVLGRLQAMWGCTIRLQVGADGCRVRVRVRREGLGSSSKTWSLGCQVWHMVRALEGSRPFIICFWLRPASLIAIATGYQAIFIVL